MSSPPVPDPPIRVLLVDDDEDDFLLTRDIIADIPGGGYTLDWQADFDVMRASGGKAIVVSEQAVVDAWELAKETGVNVSPTGSAGLAGLLPTAQGPSVKPGERVCVVLSGVYRG